MKLVKVGAAVLNQTPLAWETNKANILAAITAARTEGVNILCLPELCITGYGCEDAFHSHEVHEFAWEILEEIASATTGMAVSVGLPILHHNALFNSACLLVDGQIGGLVAKQHLAGDGIHYEPRWFKPWPAGQRSEHGSQRVPIGDVYFDCGDLMLGFEICEDAWVAQRPGGALARRGVDIILNPSASHFAFGKHEVRRRLVLEGSRAFATTYVYANLLGNEAGRILYDGGALIASGGQMLAEGSRFSFRDFVLTARVVDVDATRMKQSRSGSFQPIVDTAENRAVRLPLALTALEPDPTESERLPWEDGACVKEEEFLRAEALALFDYMRKSRARGFVVSLSGGVDSSVVSCLVASMVHLGALELGFDQFLKKLSYWPTLTLATSERALIGKLLVCVYQATENSTKTTYLAASTLAQSIGAEFKTWDVGPVVRQYLEMASHALGRSLQWPQDDLALQNIQARARGPSVWLLANVRGALLLATSNRSEAAVGYATMDGDTCGGLSPIAGVDKAYLRRWLVWLEKVGSRDVSPISALSLVNAQTPTAELRPPDQNQTDEADLMPYDILDAVERAAIRDRLAPTDVFRRVRALFPEQSQAQLAFWVEHFFRLFCRNQWKRERYAPCFHLDDENLDPKTWCRFPILSGGFERELTNLRAMVSDTTPTRH